MHTHTCTIYLCIMMTSTVRVVFLLLSLVLLVTLLPQANCGTSSSLVEHPGWPHSLRSAQGMRVLKRLLHPLPVADWLQHSYEREATFVERNDEQRFADIASAGDVDFLAR